MPKHPDIDKVILIGSGPIQIGQAAEFDFSGTQACKSLREEGVSVVLVNSNPATIMTDPDVADITYIEPIRSDIIADIIAKEKPYGIVAGLGGQTGLNITTELAEKGILDKYDIQVLGTPLEAIYNAEDRGLFKQMIEQIGEKAPRSEAVSSIKDAMKVMKELHLPLIIRPAYTLGGFGGGIARTKSELKSIVERGLNRSRIHQVLVEESVLGWKEFEYEVMRDANDTCITICNMENIDPMGIHTGESIVVTPAQTLSDTDHQTLRSAAIKIIRALGIEGGCNIQFAVRDEEYYVIEVNPRVSRSSALASKATGYPIARVAAKIAIGLTLDEIPNGVTKETPASFEPTVDYTVLKIPRWPFDKFTTADKTLTTAMKSTGEVMAIGRTLEESIHKAVRSLDIQMRFGEWRGDEIEELLRTPTDERLFIIYHALRHGFNMSQFEELGDVAVQRTARVVIPTEFQQLQSLRDFNSEKIAKLTSIDPFFIRKIQNIIDMEERLRKRMSVDNLRMAKRMGFTDERIAELTGRRREDINDLRRKSGIKHTYKMVDTCAAEFEAKTPYYYSTYETQCEANPSDRRKVLILGAGPIRIGQGIEFDYCTVHAVLALREEGIETHIINNNPETVSTDYDVSDKLFFEPLTLEDVMNVIETERPYGVAVQFGGQASVNLAIPLEKELKRRSDLDTVILGTSPESINIAEDRYLFSNLLRKLNIPQPDNGSANSVEEAKEVAKRIGYPILVRPSYVLGGRAMEIVYDETDLERYVREAVKVSHEHPVLIDSFLQGATEIDVDAVSDGENVLIGAIMEHIEEAGIHSGDSACVIPPQSLDDDVLQTVRDYTKQIALALQVKGLINLQMAAKDGRVYVFEANPRSSRTVPYVCKTVGIPLVKIAAKVMIGHSLEKLGYAEVKDIPYVSVKEVVLPFDKLPGADPILGPEMRSTGEVMGIDRDFARTFFKAELSAGNALPTEGTVFISVQDDDKPAMVSITKKMQDAGLKLIGTAGTARYLKEHGIQIDVIKKIHEGSPNIIGRMRRKEVHLVINTATSKLSLKDGYDMRRAAVDFNIPYITTIQAAKAAADAIDMAKKGKMTINSIQDYQRELL
ncbi:MAG: carbamoyl-phosphate synthase large subunit [Methanocellales archaeon]|nr:carbamoyl-phosphate synthase large subunit [Methanocellales archaeon]